MPKKSRFRRLTVPVLCLNIKGARRNETDLIGLLSNSVDIGRRLVNLRIDRLIYIFVLIISNKAIIITDLNNTDGRIILPHKVAACPQGGSNSIAPCSKSNVKPLGISATIFSFGTSEIGRII